MLYLKYHLPDEDEQEDELNFFLWQISILTVLTTASEAYVSALNPDKAMAELLHKNREAGRLTQEVFTALQSVIT